MSLAMHHGPVHGTGLPPAMILAMFFSIVLAMPPSGPWPLAMSLSIRGVDLLLNKFLKGQQDYFDASMCELIRANVAIRDQWPMVGSRAHYSLVDGGKPQDEQMPKARLPCTRSHPLDKMPTL